MNVPEWAEELTLKVCKDYKRTLPKQVWRQSSDGEYLEKVDNEDGSWTYKKQFNTSSSGTTYRNNLIRIRAGSNVVDQKLVLLHELAHHIVNKSKKGRREGHTIRFWRLAFKLYQDNGVDMDYAFGREKNYRVKAHTAFNEITKM